MTDEERLLQTIEKLLSQNREDAEFIKELCITAITEFGYDRYNDGYGIGVSVGAAGCT